MVYYLTAEELEEPYELDTGWSYTQTMLTLGTNIIASFKITGANGVYVSDDEGDTWAKIIDLASATSPAVLYPYYDIGSSTQYIYVAWVETNKIESRYSTDFGVTWSAYCADYTDGTTLEPVGWYRIGTSMYLQIIVNAASTSETAHLKSAAGSFSEIQVWAIKASVGAVSNYANHGFVVSDVYYGLYQNTSDELIFYSFDGTNPKTNIGYVTGYTMYTGQMAPLLYRRGRVTATLLKTSGSVITYGYFTLADTTFVDIAAALIIQPCQEQLPGINEYHIAIDVSNGRILAVDAFTVNIYPIYYNVNIDSPLPIALSQTICFTADKMYRVYYKALPATTCIITQSAMDIQLYQNISPFANQVLLLYNSGYSLLCRFWVQSFSHIGTMWKLNGYNLNYEPYLKKGTIAATATFGNQLINMLNLSWNLFYVSGAIDVTGSTYAIDMTDGILGDVIDFINDASSGKVYITPAGEVRFLTSGYTDNGVTLSVTNKNCIFTSETIGLTNYGSVELTGGYENGSQIKSSIEGTSGDRSLPFIASYPNVTSQTLLDLIATEILSRQETGLSTIRVSYRGSVLMQYGETCTLDLTNMSSSLSYLAASNTMYINTTRYDALRGITELDLVTSWLYDNSSETVASVRRELASLANDVQTNGNHYNPDWKGSFTQSLNNNSDTAITWDAEDHNQGGFVWPAGGTATKVEIPSAGDYLITYHIVFAANTTGQRYIQPRIGGVAQENGTNVLHVTSSLAARLSSSYKQECTAGQQLSWHIYQNSGGALTVDGYITIERTTLLE